MPFIRLKTNINPKTEFSPHSGFWFYSFQVGSNLVLNNQSFSLSYRGAHQWVLYIVISFNEETGSQNFGLFKRRVS